MSKNEGRVTIYHIAKEEDTNQTACEYLYKAFGKVIQERMEVDKS